jgi:hypothetical protein
MHPVKLYVPKSHLIWTWFPFITNIFWNVHKLNYSKMESYLYKGIAVSATTKIYALLLADDQFIIADSEYNSGQHQFPPWNDFDRFLLEIGLQTNMCE